MKIKVIDHTFSVCKVADYSKVNWGAEFVFIGKTDEESSLVCLTEDVPPNVIEQEDNWQAWMSIPQISHFAVIPLRMTKCTPPFKSSRNIRRYSST